MNVTAAICIMIVFLTIFYFILVDLETQYYDILQADDSQSEIETTAETEIDGFSLVYKNDVDTLFLYRETRTDVMYALYSNKHGYAGMGGLTVMLAPDGSPLLYSEWIEMDPDLQSVTSP